MSHYNNNSTNSWQNRSNNSSSTSSLFGTPHDLLSYSSSQQLNNTSNSTSLTGVNSPSLANSVSTNAGVYNNPAASLLAQFAVNSVNFSNLAAQIPAALVNANVLAANLGVTNTSGGYQWHTSSQQNNLQQGSNSQSSRNSDQRIVSISNSNNNSNSSTANSNGYKSSSSNGSNGLSKNSSNSSGSAHDVRPLMEIDTIRRQNNNSNSNSKANSNSTKGISSNSSNSLNNKNSNNNSNGHSNSRDRDRERNNRDRDRERDRRSVTNEQSNASSSPSSSSLGNKHNLTITTTNLNAAASNLAAANPLAQALLNQLAVQSTNPASNNALVAALAVANAVTNVTQKQVVQQQSKNLSPQRNSNNNKSSSVSRRSRSPSTNRNKSSGNTSSNRNQTNNSSSNSTSNNNKSSSIVSSTHKQHSKSPNNNSSTKRLSSSNIQTTSSSSSSNKQSSSSSSRYSIKIPKYPLDLLTNNVTGLKSRYNQLYIPSDFINVKNNWQNSLPLNRSLKFNSRCLFHIMRKEAHSICENEAIFDPPDADHTWTVKVMLLAMPSLNELYKRSCSFAEDPRDRLEHPSKVIQFLVGNKGKHELMALGGAWSASLDGPDPATNSQTLINTAIRTVKALTGIDLAPCTQWFRFLDIQYNRNEDFKTIIMPNSNTAHLNCDNNTNNINNKTSSTSNLNGNESNETTTTKRPEATLMLDDEKDIETTVIFLPNVWTLMPNSVEYQKIVDAYKNFIDNPPAPINTTSTATANATVSSQSKTSRKSNVDSNLEQEKQPQSEKQEQQHQPPLEEENKEVEMTEETNKEVEMQKEELKEDLNEDKNVGQTEFNSIEDLTKSLKAEYEAAKQANQDETNEEDESKLEPTHYSKLDVKKMKVDELRTELMARGLDTRGLKNQLTVRLKEALDLEKDKEQQNENQQDDEREDQNEQTEKQEESMKQDEVQTNDVNNDMQSNGETNDILYTHVNECDIDSIQMDDKEQNQQTEEVSKSTVETTNKQDDKTSSEKEARLERQARLEREKLYKLPQAPHIIVHPSRTAKSGKFECQLVSLSHLLDYRKEDNKESSFEVSLFAEYFNEMLLRDFGFIIYKHLLTIRTEKEKELFALAATTSNTNKRKLSSNEAEDDSKRAKVNEDSKPEEDSTKPNTEATKSLPQTIQLVKPKPKTVHPELLLAFVFFDTNKTNHLNEKDLEDLFLCIGLSLSRSKIKALVSRVNFKDGSINYRTLTDKTGKETENDSNVNFKLPSDDEIVSSIMKYDKFMKQFEARSTGYNKETGLIEINGSMIDVLNTIKSLNNSEQTVLNLDQKLKESNEEIERLKTLNKTADRAKARLNDELNDYKKKLRDQIRTNKEIDDRYIRYRDCLQRTKSQLNKLFDDIGDTLRRGQPSSTKEATKRKSASEEIKKTLDCENKQSILDSTTTSTNALVSNENPSANANANTDESNVESNQINVETCDQSTNQYSSEVLDQEQEQMKSNEFENHVDQMDEEETNGSTSNS